MRKMFAAIALAGLAIPVYGSGIPSGTVCSCDRDVHGNCTRSTAALNQFRRLTGFPNGRQGFIIDHMVPRCCNGPDRPENMQWLSAEEAKAKDAWELKQGCTRWIPQR